MKIATVGAGPAGLYLSILMKQADPTHRVVVYERGARHHVRGWGMGFWGGSWDDLLHSLYESDPTTAERVSGSAVRWRGQTLALAGEVLKISGIGHGIHRSTLQEILTDRALKVGVDIRFEEAVVSARQICDADVIVASDGVNSAIRENGAEGFGAKCLVGRNKFVWLGSDKLFEEFTNAFEWTECGWIWIHGYAIDAHTSVCIVECAPQTWRGLGFDTLSASDSLRLLESIFYTALNGSRLLNQGGDEEPLPWLNFRTITNHRWWSGNTVLLGDAAHTAHYSIGSGTRLALQSAIALADCLRDEKTPQLAFAAYQKRRRADVSAAQRDASFSARWLEEVDRYIAMTPREFFTLLRARRDPLLAPIPPALYYRLYAAAERNPMLRRLKSQVGPKARRTYGRLVRRSS